MERAVSSTYLGACCRPLGRLVPPPLAGRAVAVFLFSAPHHNPLILELTTTSSPCLMSHTKQAWTEAPSSSLELLSAAVKQPTRNLVE